MSKNEELKKRGDAVIVGSYARYPAAMVSGSGCRLTDADGREYLDFLSGIAVCALGHCHPQVSETICTQAKKLVHASNLYYTQPQIELAELICAHSFAEKVFFCNSGAEANEAAIKLARIHSPKQRYKVISLSGSFHGRTLATVAATGQPKFHQGFEPLPEGFCYAPFGDLKALEAMVDETTCAILCEPLQGEGGVRPLAKEYLAGIRSICDKHGLLLIFDEIQTGMGRTGTLFAHEQLGITPDIMTMAKALGNGLPIGAMVTRTDIAASFVPGTHASTFGGNPVASAAGVTTLKIILEEGFLAGVLEKGLYFRELLAGLAEKFPNLLTTSRGMGLIVAAVLTEKGISHGTDIVNAMFARGYLMNFAGNSVLRFVPPLIVTKAEIDDFVAVLTEVLAAIDA
ncbi:aspartate aminotransferase family protein [Desulforhopalus sp. IMCC35007]|uniref:aspartate aminotransferase family protein n=1 Tax=Desulforhopalus sp. IMCC35007 TaxID=2569543 RepID=UPI0010AEE1F3|nr:aspartate aminotransferase family protein [Desulforhopalus sp. IMCC35007]TKB11786.1 aspartate aminotransferase family protein [Desulforhopalus sp. IMCC35007]